MSVETIHPKGTDRNSSPEDHNPDLHLERLLVTETQEPWFRTFVKLDPRDYLRKVSCPVLALNGELDLQVLPV